MCLRRNPPKQPFQAAKAGRQGFGGHPLRIPPQLYSCGFLRRWVKQMPKRGDVYWVALDPALGSEIQKTRPAVIISNNSCNTYGSRVVVLPLTGNLESLYPGEAMVTVKGKRSRALGDQIRSLDKSRLRSRIEALSLDEMVAVDEAVRITLGLWP